ncbi:hypothetical protein [Rhodococcus sp. IEGM 1408]|uniref:hypothetical protein n=1 Tax=Rhodococcus sp. IEGM 1408 TaxID=3082220 RepID=UPI002954B0A1|nr:hypothetical protein [Rhodococcus sp. IEGM 1408]MDV8000760.1 hypothetical protein [Rhodococcus sp. IEGM 1408]
MTPTERLPDPAARMFVRTVMARYPLGLSMSEARRRCSRAGTVYTVDSTGRNVHEDFDEVVEHLLAAGLIEQRLIGRSVRLIDSKFPIHPEESESAS